MTNFPLSFSRAAVLSERRRGYGAQGDLAANLQIPGLILVRLSELLFISSGRRSSKPFRIRILHVLCRGDSTQVAPHPSSIVEYEHVHVSAIVETGWSMICFDFVDEYSILHNETLLQQSTLI
jgi:hypothetical protein